MLLHTLTLAAALLSLPPAQAEDTKAPTLAQTFISGKSIERLPHAAWEVADGSGSRIVSVSGQDAVQAAPASAVRYISKSYVFPTGTIFVYEFEKARGGMMHAITEETALYVLSGAGDVEIAGERVPIGQGDAVSYPTGALRGAGDAVIVAWKVTGTKPREDSKPGVVRAPDADVRHLGYWPGPDGKRVMVTTADGVRTAPPQAIRLEIRSYPFDDNTIAATKNYKGGPTNKSTGDRDGLLYITSGKMRFFQDDIDVLAGPGDAIRESAGRYHNWIRLEDSSFVGMSSTPETKVNVEKPNNY